jgi:hypothetical protein
MEAKNHKQLNTCSIHLWQVYNTLEDDSENHKCTGLFKNNKVCGRKCGFKYEEGGETKYTCKSHFPKNIQVKQKNNVKTTKK